MDNPAKRRVLNELNALPVTERMSLLACSAMQGKSGAVGPVAALIRLITFMAQMLSTEERFVIASRLRDAGDEIERQKCAHTIIDSA